MKRAIYTIVIVAALAVGAFVAWRELAERRPDLIAHPGDYFPLPKKLQRGARVMRVLYLNREGALLKSGSDDASFNRSSIVAGRKLPSVQYPAFSGSAARWRAIVRCVRAKFAPFDVRVVDQRPVETDDFVMAMVGGTSRILGNSKKLHHTTGLAPFSGRPIPRAVVMIFSAAMRNNTRTVCETAAMEIAHAYGLDHAYLCSDLMTYLKRCTSARRFVDKAVACGEHKRRGCKNGKAKQNSYRELAALLGLKPPPPNKSQPRRTAKKRPKKKQPEK